MTARTTTTGTDSSTTTTRKAGVRRIGRLPLATAAAAVGVSGMLVLGAVSAAPAGAASKVTTVKAVETDFHIALSKKTFSPGKYTFVASNKGQTTHALMITGPGIKMAMTKDISPGQSAKLTVTFKKGAYDIYCPIPGHKALGMNVNLVVKSSGGTSSSSGTGSNSSNSSSGGSSGSGGYGY